MATSNPKVTGYLTPANHEAFQAFMREYDLSMSQALNRLCEMALGSSTPLTQPTDQLKLSEQIEELLEQKVDHIRNSFELCVNELKERLEQLEKKTNTVGIEAVEHQSRTLVKHSKKERKEEDKFELPGTPLIDYIDTLKATENEPITSKKEMKNTGFSGRELAQRLGINNSRISRKKLDVGFAAWTKEKDPDGLPWRYDFRDKVFYPIV